MYRILLITDDWTAKKPLKSGLLERGFSVSALTSAELLKEDFVPPEKLDVAVADLERCATEPGKICHAIKRDRMLKDLPLILLVLETQLGRLDFGWGVEDYLTLPVSPKRLAERLNFLLWKLHRVEPSNGYSAGGLVVDFERYEVHVKGQPADLTYKEFELLKFLVTHPGKALTREALLDKVWGYDFYGGTRTVDVHIRRLRAKIETGSAVYIETIRNVGYKFLDPVPPSRTRSTGRA